MTKQEEEEETKVVKVEETTSTTTTTTTTAADDSKDTPMEDTTTKTEEDTKGAKVEETITAAPDDGSKDTPMEDTATKTEEDTKMVDDTTTTTADEKKTSETTTKTTMTTTARIKMIPSLGSMARGWSGGVSHPKCAPNIPSEAIALVDIVEKFLQDCPMPPYDPKIHTGFWRTMTVRSSRRTRECMLIFVHAPITGGVGSKDSTTVDNYTAEIFESEKSRLIAMLTGKDLPIIPAKLQEDEDDSNNNNAKPPESFLQVTSIFFQEFDGLSMPPPEHPVQHAYGAKAITEKLGKCTFQISPGAFFQVNTATAETLYNVVVEKVREVTTKPEETLCFDVCCGTGTIGLTLMKEGVVGRIVGVDISVPAIEDAKVNARLNGFDDGDNNDDDGGGKKTRFVAARAENVMQEELRRARNSGAAGGGGKIVAVVDPAREGLHTNVLKSIRGFAQIDRVVYVSCNPTGSLIQDAAALCNPPSKRFRGRPFRPTFAQPVDMFPYSNHCELVMVFDRMTDEELGEGNAKE